MRRFLDTSAVWILCLAIWGLLLLSLPAHGQVKTTPCDSIGTAPGVCWSWVVPPDGAPVATYSLYQIPLSGTACTQFTPSSANRVASSVTNTLYIQPMVTKSVCSEVTAVTSAGVEGPASDVATFLVSTTPGKPQALQTVAKP